MKLQMEQPQILEIAFKIEGMFKPLESLGNNVFDEGANEAKHDVAFTEIVKIMADIRNQFGIVEMERCAENLQFFMLGKDYHLASQAVSFAAESRK